MPVIENHPLRLRRVRAGLSQTEVATRAGLTRAAVAQIEEGRTRPNPTVVSALAMATNSSMAMLWQELQAWDDTPVTLSADALATLRIAPATLMHFESYGQWRTEVAPSIAAFSSLLRVPTSTLAKYEHNASDAMPKSLREALANKLNLSADYIEAIEVLHDRV